MQQNLCLSSASIPDCLNASEVCVNAGFAVSKLNNGVSFNQQKSYSAYDNTVTVENACQSDLQLGVTDNSYQEMLGRQPHGVS